MPELIAEQALVLSARQFGERSWILALMTREHGRINGLYQHKKPPETGTFVKARWKARLSEQLGHLYLEETIPFSIAYMDDANRLACITSVCDLLNETLPERQAFPDIYDSVKKFFDQLDQSDFIKNYILFENSFLSDIGFGLDLTACAGGGDVNDLAYVSPKTGRAVSRQMGTPYQDKLLTLPKFLWQSSTATAKDLKDGLILTGYFLTQHSPKHRLPTTRDRLFRYLLKHIS